MFPSLQQLHLLPKDRPILLLAATLSCMHLFCPDPRCPCCLRCTITHLWPWQSLLQSLPPFAAIASRYSLTLVIASHCLPLPLPSMVGCCILPCSVIRCPPCCPLLPSLTLSLPAAALSSFWSVPSSFLLPPFIRQQWLSFHATNWNLKSRRAPFVCWCSCLSSILAGCCVASHHAAASCLPPPLPVVLPLPLVIHHDWLLHCHLHLSLHYHLQSAWTSTSFYSLPPHPATKCFCPLLLRLNDVLSFCQLWQWAKTSIPDNHDGNGNGNDGGNGNNSSNGDSNGVRDFSSTSTPISLSLFDSCMF